MPATADAPDQLLPLQPAASGARRTPQSFGLDLERLRDGYYSDAYFNHTKQILETQGRHPRVVMQIFQRKDAILGGVDEALAMLRLCAGRRRTDGTWAEGWSDLEVRALRDGDRVSPFEPVITIKGDYTLFAHLETVYLGVLARRTLISRNVAAVVEAAGTVPVLFFPARFDHYASQAGDGLAAHIAGAVGASTDAQASLYGERGLGTVPHALIAAYGGDTVAAARGFAATFAGKGMRLAPLVDFHNDCTRTAVEVADALGEDLWGVRLDTSGSMVDRCLWKKMGTFAPTGVCPELVREVRAALDAAGHERVRIMVSGGFGPEKIRRFRELGVPVDAYGVGSSLLRGDNDFTADIVRVDGEPCAKTGRRELPADRLEAVTL